MIFSLRCTIFIIHWTMCPIFIGQSVYITGGKPEDEALKNTTSELASNAEVDTATQLTDEELDAPNQKVTGEGEDEEDDDQADSQRDPEQENGQAKEAQKITEDTKLSGPQDEKKEESEEGDLRSRKKIRVETVSLSLPGETSQQTPGNGLTFSTPVSKDEDANGASPAQAKGHVKSPSITELRLLPPPQVSRGTKVKVTPKPRITFGN